MYQQVFSENQDNKVSHVSQDDIKFIDLMDSEVKIKDSHYELPLPLRNKDTQFVNNRAQAFQRAMWLKGKLPKNDKMYQDYCDFMQNLMVKGYAKPVTSTSYVQSGKYDTCPTLVFIIQKSQTRFESTWIAVHPTKEHR